ncbi:MAG TPA: efflux RND transporter periplasmic adaptor subunit [Thermoanaerobaculia bacterium]|nr:efflux RND transporter periplasmic adaptor subunit [Thermoanaerobaculia bacterium]
MKRWLIVAGAAVLIAVIIVISVRSGNTEGEKVYVEPAVRKTIQAVVTAPGEVDPRVKVNISAHIVGKIEKLYFNEGDSVKRGQKLVELEKPTYVAQRDRLAAALRSSRVEVIRARAALNTANSTFRRAQSLQQQGIQAQELFERARLDHDNAVAALGSAEEGVRQSEAGLRSAEEDLSRTTILAPMDGKVVQLNAHEGEVVVTGTMNNPGSVIAVLADLSEILVEAEVGETEVVSVHLDQPATIKVDAVSDKEYRGHVVEIGSSAAVRAGAGSGIRYFKVKVAIDDPDDRLRPGMTSQVSIVTKSAAGSVAVPIQAVVERVSGAKKGEEDSDDENKPKKKYVFLAQDGKAKMIEVTTGISDATHVAIVSGIKAGDSVVTGPFRTLKKLGNGDAIRVEKEAKASKSEDSKE